MCDLRSGAATSLVELEFASHTAAEADESARVPPGLPFYSIQARMSELDVVFLNRFLMARPPSGSQSHRAGSNVPHPGSHEQLASMVRD